MSVRRVCATEDEFATCSWPVGVEAEVRLWTCCWSVDAEAEVDASPSVALADALAGALATRFPRGRKDGIGVKPTAEDTAAPAADP